MDGTRSTSHALADPPAPSAAARRHVRRDAEDVWYPPTLSGLEFPGCDARRLRRDELTDYDGRLEFWDSETETMWVCEPTTPYHEEPGAALPGLLTRIASVRGSPVKCYGTMDLMVRDRGGAPRRIMQADQSVYLHPSTARLPGRVAMVVGEHDFPDVVLEVDHTTDARRGKLKLYEAWGFPEVWIHVPDRPAASRRRRRASGLTIHVLRDGAYEVASESRALPGWTAAEIHRAFDEATSSAETLGVLERVGLALGAREGTGPDDDPLLDAQRREVEERGRAEGFAEGRAEGRVEDRADSVRQILLSRGIAVSAGFPMTLPGFADLPKDRVIAVAIACESEADFEARIQGTGD